MRENPNIANIRSFPPFSSQHPGQHAANQIGGFNSNFAQ